MVNPKTNYLIDILIGILFIIISFTGIIMLLFLHSGVKQGSYQTFLGITKANWLFIHNWAGILLIIFVIIHFLFHWNWFISMTKQLFKQR